MNVFRIKKLIRKDKNELIRFLNQRSLLFKDNFSSNHFDIKKIDLSDGPIAQGRFFAYGAFDGRHLEGIFLVYTWKSIKFYTILGMYLVNPSKSVSRYREFMSKMFNYITEEMEQALYFNFYTITLLRPFQVQQMTDSKRSEFIGKYIENYNRYSWFIERIVKPGELPDEPSFREMMNQTPQKKYSCIKFFSLKNIHRLEPLGLKKGCYE